jgi:hypothetical protein
MTPSLIASAAHKLEFGARLTQAFAAEVRKSVQPVTDKSPHPDHSTEAR